MVLCYNNSYEFYMWRLEILLLALGSWMQREILKKKRKPQRALPSLCMGDKDGGAFLNRPISLKYLIDYHMHLSINFKSSSPSCSSSSSLLLFSGVTSLNFALFHWPNQSVEDDAPLCPGKRRRRRRGSDNIVRCAASRYPDKERPRLQHYLHSSILWRSELECSGWWTERRGKGRRDEERR